MSTGIAMSATEQRVCEAHFGAMKTTAMVVESFGVARTASSASKNSVFSSIKKVSGCTCIAGTWPPVIDLTEIRN